MNIGLEKNSSLRNSMEKSVSMRNMQNLDDVRMGRLIEKAQSEYEDYFEGEDSPTPQPKRLNAVPQACE